MSSTLLRLAHRRSAAATAAAVLVGLGVTPALAASAPVTVLEVRQCDIANVRAAVSSVPDGGTAVVRLLCNGVISLGPDDTIVHNRQSNVTIDASGRSVTFDGNGVAQPFFVAGRSTLGLRHLTVQNGFAGQLLEGGAIRNHGSLRIDDVLFQGNRSFNGGGAIATSGSGSVTVTNSRFVGNRNTCTSDGIGGGAVSHTSSGPLTITRSAFTGNRAVGSGQGGALFLAPTTGKLNAVAAPAVLRGVAFTDNQSEVQSLVYERGYGGGAISVQGRPLTVDRSSFDGNRSTFFGGAISFLRETYKLGRPVYDLGPGGGLTVLRSTFTGNAATGGRYALTPDDTNAPFISGLGGAVQIGGPDADEMYPGPSPFRIHASTFTGNVAGRAGALVTRTAGDITASQFLRNLATNTEAVDPQKSDALLVLRGRVMLTSTTMRDSPTACLALFGSSIVDGGRNNESPGTSCGFGTKKD